MFAETLKMLRNAAHLSQKALADRLFVSQQTVAKWELDKSTPNPEMLIKIAEVFDVTVDHLVGKSPIKKAPAGAGAESEAEAALYEAFKGLSEEQQRQVIEYAEFLRHKQEAE